MKGNQLFSIILVAVVVAICVSVALKLLNYDNLTVAGGAIAGGVTGGILGALKNKK